MEGDEDVCRGSCGGSSAIACFLDEVKENLGVSANCWRDVCV